MITIGCDIGSLNFRVVVLRNGDRVLSAQQPTDATILDRASHGLSDILKRAGVVAEGVDALVVSGRHADRLAQTGWPGRSPLREPEASCLGWAVTELLPEVEQLIDLGGQSITAVTVNDQGEVLDLLRNDKCASGTGRFLELMAEALGVNLEQLQGLADRAESVAPISDQCGVFVESEVVSLLNAGTPPAAVAAGVCDAVARIAAGQARRLVPWIGNDFNKERAEACHHQDAKGRNIGHVQPISDAAYGNGMGTVGRYTLTGGVARIDTVVRRVHHHLGGSPLRYPDDPGFAVAFGAALIAEAEAEADAGQG